LQPLDIPTRTCNNAVTVSDANTIEVAQALKDSLFAHTGCYPHLIINHLHRSKLDCNRNLADGACGNATAVQAWNEFHNFIVDAQSSVQSAFPGKAFFLDLHGHGNPIQRVELGYLLYDDELALSDSILNTATYVGYSSIRQLVSSNVGNLSHAQLLRGSTALGTLLQNAGYPAVPSALIPAPGLNTNYYSGGYIIANHSSYQAGNPINGVQMELNYTGIRDTPENIHQFAGMASTVIMTYLNQHLAPALDACSLSALQDTQEHQKMHLMTNPISSGESPRLEGFKSSINIELYNVWGNCLWKGKARNQQPLDIWPVLPSGLYWMHALSKQENKEANYQRVTLPVMIE